MGNQMVTEVATLSERINEGFRQVEATLDRADELAAERLGIGRVVSESVETAVCRCQGCVEEMLVLVEYEPDPNDFMADPFDFSPGDQVWMTGRAEGGRG